MEFIRPLRTPLCSLHSHNPLARSALSGFGSAILKTGIPKHFRVEQLQLCLLVLRISAPGTLNFEKGGIQVEATSPTQDHTPKAKFETTMT